MEEPPDIHTVLCSLGLVNERMGCDETCSDVAEDDEVSVGGKSHTECDASSAPLSERKLSPVSIISVNSSPDNMILPAHESLIEPVFVHPQPRLGLLELLSHFANQTL
ncbi:hypothetical protein B0A48_18788 [Cryoendolithus antarcticus]|uniref:Uncharacterized protein n=1 Tax=Cryoendolithus antarcticus TaxID=1507870 RepID=A0A1V8S8I9_9PEZI|nr:hypothetical protein B0A48_18788 [Cryoendolithus antarcticus]